MGPRPYLGPNPDAAIARARATCDRSRALRQVARRTREATQQIRAARAAERETTCDIASPDADEH